ncbi:MAG: single-stranded DNA-binding protein [Pelagibacterales bacterium]|nr:single-stranded DNA-binding protein [Pelagibacterales bacterium]OUU61984.1 MAG: single-stranded DNA-binding protein [Alphaproteobacteria bacterium TMED62]|tara:strand:+ start:3757 stop:4209 length:453 start_codon:yes stop_codon:yes gene_type:complete
MAYSINKVILVGNVGNEPELKTFQSGDRVINFSIATSESWKDKESGEQKSITEWHKIAIFNNALVEIADKYIKKGMKVYVEGQVQTRKWQDSSGNDRYTTEIVLQKYRGELVLLDKADPKSVESIKNTENKSPIDDFNGKSINLDDDIPF